MTEVARATVAPGLSYKDPREALRWLEAAFGFEVIMIVENPDGSIGHSEMRVGPDGVVMVGFEWDAFHKSPASLGGVNAQSIHVHLDDAEDMDAHHDRAVAAGAVTLRPPADQFYGDRSYMVSDPEGHQWSFSRKIRDMTLEEMSKAGGVSVRERLVKGCQLSMRPWPRLRILIGDAWSNAFGIDPRRPVNSRGISASRRQP